MIYDSSPFEYIRFVDISPESTKKCWCGKPAKCIIIKKRRNSTLNKITPAIAKVDAVCGDCLTDELDNSADFIIKDCRKSEVSYTDRQWALISDIDSLTNIIILSGDIF